MNLKEFQEARDFAGADWENLKPSSRSQLLNGYRIPDRYSKLKWAQLPPTVKRDLTMPLLKKERNG